MDELTNMLPSELTSLSIDRSVPPRSAAARNVLLVALLLAVTVGAVLAKPYLEATFYKTPVDVTEVSLVSPIQASIALSSSGYVVPHTRSAVCARSPGRVASVYVQQGQRVEAGQLLLRLERSAQLAELQAIKLKAQVARAQVGSAAAALEEVRHQAQRQHALVKQGAAPAAVAEDLEARMRSQEAAVRVAQAQADAADAEVAVIEAGVDALSLSAPIAGVVLSRPPELGEVLGAELGSALESGSIEIADLSTLYVETDVPEARLPLVQLGAPCEIALDAYPQRRFRGETVQIMPRVSRSKASVGVKVRFVDDVGGVLPDMSARVSFLSAGTDPAQIGASPKRVVPAAAVVRRGAGHFVFVVDGDAVHARSIMLGARLGDVFELQRGPEAGTRVVNEPPKTLADGGKIKERGDS